MKIHIRAAVALAAVAAYSIVQAQAAPDNTKQNKMDSMNTSVSADAQMNNRSDLAVTKQIRRSVMADKNLSSYAHNVKIVSVNGNVTLNGVVHTQEEKDAIQSKAQAVVKRSSVVNNLKITP